MEYNVGESIRGGPGVTAYKKRDEELEEYSAKGGARKKKGKTANKENTDAPKTETGDSGKKNKFVPLYNKDGKGNVIQLAGRHVCECQALKHKLINNCLSCGRVVCAQEGSGPCMFCNTLVCTKEEQEVLGRQSRKSEQLLLKLAGDSREQYKDNSANEKAYQKALDSKNMLLDFDKSCEKRTKVIDDESDYFNIDSNKWLTPEQRAALAKKSEQLQEERHNRSRRDIKLNFDFAGRKVVEDETVPEYIIHEDKQMMKLFKDDQFSVEAEMKRRAEQGGGVLNPNLGSSRPIYDESMDYAGRKDAAAAAGGERIGHQLGRVQDSALQEITDQGTCLSMHQPWASLLVLGIKLHEGRTWYSNHRGRLWIHAASKQPTKEETDQLHNFYKVHSGIQTYQFPPHYPTSCLVGSVDVTDVLSQEEYRLRFPDGESSSPYVFICENPQDLLIKFPMSGKHKLFQLDPKIHKAAVKTVKKTPGERSGVPGL